MYEQFEHTADLGLRIIAPNLNQLFAEAGECLFSVIVDDPTAIRERSEFTLAIEGTDKAYLLFDWLKELLLRFDRDGMLFTRFEVSVRDDGLSARIAGEPFDPARHALLREVKAITYHDLIVEESAEGWQAEVIVDI
jgi:SHS2 domain-containing protein